MTNEFALIRHITKMSWRLLIIMAAMSFAVPCRAQNNPFKINDQLYTMYDQAFRQRTTKTGRDLALQMYRRANAIGDHRAQVLALTIPMLYYYNERNDAEFEKAVDELLDKALQYHQEKYYYFGVSNRVNYLLLRHRMYEALTYIQSKSEFAKKNNHKYGVYSTLCMFGLVHKVRMEIGLAVEKYSSALEYAQKNLPIENVAPLYTKISSCYEGLSRFQEMFDNAVKGLELSRTNDQTEQLLRNAAYASFMLEKYDKFKEYYDRYTALLNREANPRATDPNECEMGIMNLMYSSKYDEAKNCIVNFPGKGMYRKYCLWIEYNRLVGDYLEMTNAQTTLYRSRIKAQDSVRSNNFMEMNARFVNQKLEYENQRLEMDRQNLLSQRQTTELTNTHLKLANTQLTLRNSSLELRKAKSNSDLLRLSYDNKQLEADKLQHELNAEKAQKRLHDALLMSALAIGVLLLIAVAIYIWNRRKLMLRLEHANDTLERNNNELLLAKEKAVAADRVKTVFIQNMSHEIRTPLNAIVGFSELIAGDDGSMDEDMRNDFGERIKTNSDNLIMLVGDVLDTAQLESGTYNLQYRSVTIGEICLKAMSLSGQHKLPGVKMQLETDELDNMQIHTDVKRVVQVLVNMLSNAEKNTINGTITLGCSTKSTPGMVTFSVTDTGIGVPRDKAEEIFKSFTKLDQFKQGLGLGLHICRIIADLLGGSIYLDTTYTGGARFLFSIKA